MTGRRLSHGGQRLSSEKTPAHRAQRHGGRGVAAERQRERVLDELRDALADWRGLLRQEPGPARRALRALLTGRLVFTPGERAGEPFYAFSGEGTLGKVIEGLALPKGGVSPAGFEPALSP
jgi:hypothetical protein